LNLNVYLLDKIEPVIKLSRRTWLLILVGLALMAVLLLAGSLRNLTFQAGKPLTFEQMLPDMAGIENNDELTQRLIAIMRVLFILGWVLLPFYIIFLIVSPEARKRLLRDIITMLPILLLAYFLLREPPDKERLEPFEMRMESQSLEEGVTRSQEPLVFDANPSEWVVNLTAIALAIAATAFVVGILWVYLRSRQSAPRTLTRVAEEAQAAIDAIEAGGDLRDVIMRCYFEMNRAIGDTRNLKRNADMTAHEFEAYLSEKGLPHEPIHNLTELFERVRYSTFTPGRQEERLAVSSLSAIVSAVRRVSR
jgi:hypothetical protein